MSAADAAPLPGAPRGVVHYVRHGQTDWNAELRFQGQKDIPLNDFGRAQAALNGRKLAALIADPARQRFIASPLGRTRETMEIVRREMGLPPHDYEIDERLIEASYGELEGTTLVEFKAADPHAHARRRTIRWDFQPPGGESHAMVCERVRPWIDTMDKPAIVVAHGVVGRVLRRLVLGLEAQAAAEYVFPQDRVFVWHRGSEDVI